VGTIGVSVLAVGQSNVAQALSARAGERFVEVEWQVREQTAVLILGAALWLTCSLRDEIGAGDHDIAVLEVLGLQAFPEVAPLVFHGSSFCRLSQ
jgi:flavin reductase (DIM6/NTAB) family NADH-FMN oxidoreductase RutF